MIHDDGTPNTEPRLPDTDIDAFLDKVDAAYEALPIIERRRLRRSVQQAQQEITQPDGVDYLARHLDAAELFPAHAFDATTAQTHRRRNHPRGQGACRRSDRRGRGQGPRGREDRAQDAARRTP